ncbi:APC family permease [Parvularcula oceani]|uniref:APC family permease n=1 Tax=Parvularcula oceani TaxID=1247963 RepID=UPI0006913573|nr:APC family permease [Parvularcula oceani]
MARDAPDKNQDSHLQRSMGLPGLAFYGTGTILGAGIFVVIGEVVAEAGALSPLAYALAGTVALMTALSFGELGARIPTAGGPIDYVEKAFDSRRLAVLTGWVLTAANIVSGATITTGFVDYLGSFLDVPGWAATAGLVAVLCGISCIGMKQSAWFMTITTLIGMATLLFILWVARDALLAAPGAVMEDLGAFDGAAAGGLYAGAFLAFYSFIGFGDMAQTAEEVKHVKTTLPRAIIIAMAVVFTFYLAVSAALIGGENGQEIAQAEAPLVKVVELRGIPALPVAIASLFVIVNGGLTQVITAARLLLDLGRDDGGAPSLFGRVNQRTNTPVIATLFASAFVLALALFIPLKGLASATSLAVLLVFFGVNAALWQLKRQGQPDDVPNVWRIVPAAGAVLCAFAVLGQIGLWVGV